VLLTLYTTIISVCASYSDLKKKQFCAEIALIIFVMRNG